MRTTRFFASLLLAGATLAPTFALAADYDVPPMTRGHHSYGLPYPLSLDHNYGPAARYPTQT